MNRSPSAPTRHPRPTRPPAPNALPALTAAALLLCSPILAGAQQQQQPSEPPPLFVEQVDVNVVNVEVFVTDKSGARVAGLTADDFEIYEDGEPVEVSNFYTIEWQDTLLPGNRTAVEDPAELPRPRKELPPDQRLSLVVYVDHATLEPAARRQILEVLEGFLEDRLIEGDAVMLVGYHRTLEIVEPFTRDHHRIVEALRQMSKDAAYGPMSRLQRRQVMRSMELLVAQEGGFDQAHQLVRSHVQSVRSEVRREVKAMEKVVRAMAGLPGRKAMLLVSGGLPQRPGEDLYQYLQDLSGVVNLTGVGDLSVDLTMETLAEDQSAVFQRIARQANAHQVTLYALDANGAQGSPSLSAEMGMEDVGIGLTGGTTMDALRAQNVQEPLIYLAQATGGASILGTNNFDDALTRMATDFDTYYSLGYNSPGAGDGEFHRIEVKVDRPGLRVRHRSGYTDKPRQERVADRTLSSLLLDLESNPLNVEVEFGEPEERDRKTFYLPVLVRIPFEEVTLIPNGDRQEGRLEIFVAVKDEKGQISDLHQQDYPVRIPEDQLELAMEQSIGYYAKLAIRPGRPKVAVGVWDEISGEESFVQSEVLVGAAPRDEGKGRRGRRDRRSR